MSGNPELTFEQLRDVRDCLKKPLAEQPVFIPLGNNAFVRGKLTPRVVDGEEHVVLVQRSGQTIEVEKRRALAILDQEMDDTLPKKRITPKKTEPIEAKSKDSPELPLPSFVDIQEEINEAGVPIRCEVVNVSRHLEALKKTSGDSFAFNHTSDVESVELQTDPPPKTLSDTEYDALAERLDELARLEAQAESKQQVNLVSSRKVKQSGWSKGFLLQGEKSTRPKKLSRNADLKGKSERHVSFKDTEGQDVPRLGGNVVRDMRQTSIDSFEESTIATVVTEKPRRKKHLSTVAKNDSPQQPQKLSRFAQQRQQER